VTVVSHAQRSEPIGLVHLDDQMPLATSTTPRRERMAGFRSAGRARMISQK